MKNKYLNNSLFICSLLITLSVPVNAAKKDLTEETTITSQRQSADLKNKIIVYLDEVKINQGSIAIIADIVKVSSKIDSATNKKSNTYLAKGNPTTFKQQLEDGSLISLQANEITYQPDLNIITVSGNAQVLQAGSKVTAETITYNTSSEKLEAQGNGSESVTTILQPGEIKAQLDKKNNDSN